MISAVANWPGRSASRGFGTTASTGSVRLVSSIAAPIRSSRPSCSVLVALDADADDQAGLQVGRLALGHRELKPQRVGAHDREHRRAGRAVLADGHLTFPHGAIERRAQHGVLELLARDLDLGPALRQHSPRDCGSLRARPDAGLRPLRAQPRPRRATRASESPRSTNVFMRSRFRRASCATARRWRTRPVCSGSTASPSPPGASPRRTRAWTSAASACWTRSSKSVGMSRATICPVFTSLPRSTRTSATRPATLNASAT